MKVADVQDRGDIIIIYIPDTKTNKPRTSCITEPLWIQLIRRYASLRPAGIESSRFFLYYAKSKCSKQPVGINTFGKMPSKIAGFLKLDDPMTYTGHCFRRSSATILAGHGADITTLKRHGGWKSTAVAEGYIEDSLKSKIAIANQLVGQITSTSQPSTSSINNVNIPISSSSSSSTSTHNVQVKLGDANVPPVSIMKCENCTINFNFN